MPAVPPIISGGDSPPAGGGETYKGAARGHASPRPKSEAAAAADGGDGAVTVARPRRRPKKLREVPVLQAKLYKTKPCRRWHIQTPGSCKMGPACFFSHGEGDVSSEGAPIPVPDWLLEQLDREGIKVTDEVYSSSPSKVADAVLDLSVCQPAGRPPRGQLVALAQLSPPRGQLAPLVAEAKRQQALKSSEKAAEEKKRGSMRRKLVWGDEEAPQPTGGSAGAGVAALLLGTVSEPSRNSPWIDKLAPTAAGADATRLSA